jgi:hypothetical protein
MCNVHNVHALHKQSPQVPGSGTRHELPACLIAPALNTVHWGTRNHSDLALMSVPPPGLLLYMRQPRWTG